MGLKLNGRYVDEQHGCMSVIYTANKYVNEPTVL